MSFAILSPLHRATRQITLALEAAIAQAGLDLSADEGHVVCYLAAYGPCRTGEVQRVLGAHASTVTSMLDRLVRRQVARRLHDPADGRVRLLTLTPAGEDLASQILPLGEAVEARIRARLQARDLVALDRIGAAITAATGITIVDRRAREET